MMDRRDQDEYMSAGSADAAALDELQRLLEQQVRLLRRGSIMGLEELSERTDALVAQVAGTKLTRSSAFMARKPRLERLYRELSLTLAAQQREVGNALHTIRRGKKTVRAYRMGGSGR
jgi:hypothetical protein